MTDGQRVTWTAFAILAIFRHLIANTSIFAAVQSSRCYLHQTDGSENFVDHNDGDPDDLHGHHGHLLLLLPALD